MSLPFDLSVEQCQQARMSRDARFDGKFYVAVKTTGIYCRPICPAPAPKESNVDYYASAIEAANEGFRPCLRCRPDSAPGSYAWKGVDTTVERALKLIDQGALIEGSVSDLAERLGISDRHLRGLFQDKLGTSPKSYALYQQLLFAKQLLHQTDLSVIDVAYGSGFHSVRRFNDSFKQHFQLTPQQLRKQHKPQGEYLQLWLSYRPPYRWDLMQQFLSKRLIEGLEWIDEHSYGRTFYWPSNSVSNGQGGEPVVGYFTATHHEQKHGFEVKLHLQSVKAILPVVRNIRRILDLDTDIALIEQQLQRIPQLGTHIVSGLRLPGIWDCFEAGIRAVLGQQISVEAARKLVLQLVTYYGQRIDVQGQQRLLFPSPQQLQDVDFMQLKIPQTRRMTLQGLSRYCLQDDFDHDLDLWLSIKGIGPWTVNYAKMRGQSDSDIWLGSDLGVIKALKQFNAQTPVSQFEPEDAKPWRSYLTFQCWGLLG